ncbi:hypothetical protein EDC01DRAFT_626392 [Geopyxis carbonaria]|nr:hypothetical protein EDC01DRAFT_626392 [Geopyxis carbonaria]
MSGTGSAADSPSPPASASSAHKTVRRRNRVINSCLECRRRKLKCSRVYPCAACTKHNRKCVFLDGALDSIGLHKLTEIKNRVGSLEDLLETEVAGRSQRNSSEDSNNMFGRSGGPSFLGRGIEGVKEEDLNSNSIAFPEMIHENDVDDELSDLGMQIGMLRISERVGGVFRPQITKEVERTLSQSSDEEARRTVRFSPAPPTIHERILPSSNIFTSSEYTSTTSSVSFVPNQNEADLLYFQYFTCVDPVSHIIHKPTFDEKYGKFWNDLYQGTRPVRSTAALIHCVFFAAAVSLSQQMASLHFGLTKQALVDKFRVSAEQALAKANFLRTSRLETLQAFTIYLIPQCRAEISRSHSSLVGSLIRLAESISLHRDNEDMGFGFSPLDRHLRRLLWYQICFLDVKTVEIHGPLRPTIRDDEFDTQLPLNVDDTSFVSEDHEPVSVIGWTSTTFSLIRYECYRAHRLILRERSKNTMTLTQLRDSLEIIKCQIKENYIQYLDERIPIQKCAKMTARLLMARCDIMLLQRHIRADLSGTEGQLKNSVLRAGLEIMECGMYLETAAEMAPWAWYAGAYQQYQSVLFMLTEASAGTYLCITWFPDLLTKQQVQRNPEGPYQERIWTVMDYVFGSCSNLTREERGKDIVICLKEKMDDFLRMRKLKNPDQSTSSPTSNSRSTSVPLDQMPKFPSQWRGSNTLSNAPEARDMGAEFQMPPGMQANVANWLLPGLQNSGETVNVDWLPTDILNFNFESQWLT